jgi:hypothetical protein
LSADVVVGREGTVQPQISQIPQIYWLNRRWKDSFAPESTIQGKDDTAGFCRDDPQAESDQVDSAFPRSRLADSAVGREGTVQQQISLIPQMYWRNRRWKDSIAPRATIQGKDDTAGFQQHRMIPIEN